MHIHMKMFERKKKKKFSPYMNDELSERFHNEVGLPSEAHMGLRYWWEKGDIGGGGGGRPEYWPLTTNTLTMLNPHS